MLQYYLEYIALFVPTVQSVVPDGIFGAETENAVISFQKTYGFTPDGVVDRALWNSIQNTYYNTLSGINYQFREGVTLPYGGRILTEGVVGEDVRALQEYLNFISNTFPEIPKVNPDGIFGPATAAQVRAFKTRFELPGNPDRVSADTWRSITDLYEDLYFGGMVNEGQFPGYTLRR